MEEHSIEALASHCIKRPIHAIPCIHTGGLPVRALFGHQSGETNRSKFNRPRKDGTCSHDGRCQSFGRLLGMCFQSELTRS
jgi:hypothetical protein